MINVTVKYTFSPNFAHTSVIGWAGMGSWVGNRGGRTAKCYYWAPPWGNINFPERKHACCL